MNFEYGKDAREDQDTLSKRIKVDNNQSYLLHYTNRQSLSEILAQLAAGDGFSYLIIAHSKFIHHLYHQKALFLQPVILQYP